MAFDRYARNIQRLDGVWTSAATCTVHPLECCRPRGDVVRRTGSDLADLSEAEFRGEAHEMGSHPCMPLTYANTRLLIQRCYCIHTTITCEPRLSGIDPLYDILPLVRIASVRNRWHGVEVQTHP